MKKVRTRTCVLLIALCGIADTRGEENKHDTEFFSLRAELAEERAALKKEIADLPYSEQVNALTQWRDEHLKRIRRMGSGAAQAAERRPDLRFGKPEDVLGFDEENVSDRERVRGKLLSERIELEEQLKEASAEVRLSVLRDWQESRREEFRELMRHNGVQQTSSLVKLPEIGEHPESLSPKIREFLTLRTALETERREILSDYAEASEGERQVALQSWRENRERDFARVRELLSAISQ